jgi:DNA-binding NarL/FixJ family response regulator
LMSGQSVWRGAFPGGTVQDMQPALDSATAGVIEPITEEPLLPASQAFPRRRRDRRVPRHRSRHSAMSATATGASRPVQGPTARLTLVGRSEPVRDTIRVLIADGHALVRAGLRALLEHSGPIRVVGEADTGEAAVASAASTRPDVVLIDSTLPGVDCVEAIKLMSAESGAAVMLLTSSECDDCLLPALRAGASGMLLKDADPAELVRAVDALARGEAPLSPRLTRRLIAEVAFRPEPQCPSVRLLDELTAREQEILVLVALGLSNGEIAERLVISPATAKTHVSRAMLKLNARDRAGLVIFAYEAGLVSPRAPAAGRRIS